MLEEISRSLYRIRGSFGSNIYAVTTDGLALVDCGFPMDLPTVCLGLRGLGATPRDIDLVIATHYHGDHTGTAAGLRRRHGIQVAMHKDDAPYASGDTHQETTEVAFLTLLFYTALWPFFRYRHFQPDRYLEEGEEIDLLGGLRVLHTPGHSRGSICLYGEQRGILFSGDLVRNESGILEGPPPHYTPDQPSACRSLLRVSQLDFDILLPGHGKVILSGAGGRFRNLLEEGKIWPLGPTQALS
ncbi:MAG: MBL fold metallo-hydrolase [Actinobacteria bacterium]|nr:MBL fold metallo-hydrolase [Actinomycetota bacterium]